MSSITAVQEGIWRWDGVDIDQGFPIVGYIIAGSEGLLLVDPPHDPSVKEAITNLGQPFATVITSAWHVRGAPMWAQTFQIPIAAPPSARGELREANAQSDLALIEGHVEEGWQVLKLAVKPYDEVAFWNATRRILVLGDLLVADENGRVVLGPHQYMDVPVAKLRPIVERVAALKPELLLSAHLGPRDDAAQILSTLLETMPTD